MFQIVIEFPDAPAPPPEALIEQLRVAGLVGLVHTTHNPDEDETLSAGEFCAREVGTKVEYWHRPNAYQLHCPVLARTGLLLFVIQSLERLGGRQRRS